MKHDWRELERRKENRKRDELVIELSWVTIKSPFAPIVWWSITR